MAIEAGKKYRSKNFPGWGILTIINPNEWPGSPCPVSAKGEGIDMTFGAFDPDDLKLVQEVNSQKSWTSADLVAFHEQFNREAEDLIKKKNADYGQRDGDPFRNFRSFGLIGILVRMSDKLARLRTFAENGDLKIKTESVHDTCQDLANYAMLFEAYLKDEEARGGEAK